MESMTSAARERGAAWAGAPTELAITRTAMLLRSQGDMERDDGVIPREYIGKADLSWLQTPSCSVTSSVWGTECWASAYLDCGRGVGLDPRLTFAGVSRPMPRMIFGDLIGDVIRTLWAHKLRTFLTMFGIAWGVVSIVLMVGAGEGLRVGQAKVAETLGKDVMIVFHGRTSLQAGGARAGRVVHWEDQDVPVVVSESPDCQYAVPELEQETVRTHSNYNNAAFLVTGSFP